MTNKKNLAAMLVITLAFAFMVIGCPDSSEEDDPIIPPPSVNVFNGTWFGEYEDEDGNIIKEKLVLNEKAFEIAICDEDGEQFVNMLKGTITFTPTLAQFFNITLTITHYSGDILYAMFSAGKEDVLSEVEDLLTAENYEEETIEIIIAMYEEVYEKISFPLDWYDKTDIVNVLMGAFGEVFGIDNINVNDINASFGEMLDEAFAQQTGTVLPGATGGKLTLTITIDGEETVYTKQ